MFHLVINFLHRRKLIKLSGTAELIRLSLINTPGEWHKTSECRFTHKPSGLKLWIGSGLFYLAPYGDHDNFKFSLVEKAVLWPLVVGAIDKEVSEEAISRAAWARAMMGEK